MTGPRVAIIAAVAENGVIGSDGDMPWRLSTDLKRFKQITMGKPVIMGRRTFQTLGKPLPGRTNIVVTRDPSFRADGVVTAGDLPAALAAASDAAGRAGSDEVFVIGGGQIYAAAIDRADRLYITHVDAQPAGDTHFPPIDPGKWRQLSSEPVPAGDKDSAATTYTVYERTEG